MTQSERVIRFLKNRPGEILATKEVARGVYDENREAYREKAQNLLITNPGRSVVDQIAAEIPNSRERVMQRESNISVYFVKKNLLHWVYTPRSYSNVFEGVNLNLSTKVENLPQELVSGVYSLAKNIDLLSQGKDLSKDQYENLLRSVDSQSKELRKDVLRKIEGLESLFEVLREVKKVIG